MHASMMNGGEEVADAREVFTDLGVLIVEGRVPGAQFAAGRGYGEGPHCPKPTPAAVVSRHDCDSSFLCARAENLRKHVQLLWENNVPLCVEVLLCADCPCGAQKATCTDVANVPSPGDLLLEQWLVTMVPLTKRCSDPLPMTLRGLFQAVRSQLHFSQLSAWWSSSKGSSPVHVNYRVTVPGEAFASQFRNQPLLHSFPIASVSKSTCVKVSVRTTPRMEFVPLVTCALHHDCDTGAAGGEEPASRGDKLLGESLLDPPQNLDHFSRKYQSPSRGGSPAAEGSERRGFARCRRDHSPPSPPMSLQHPRRGRQGLARRRDASFTEPAPGVVDDRMQNPCTRPGKHHCRCAYEEDLEPLTSSATREPSPDDDPCRNCPDDGFRTKCPPLSEESHSKLFREAKCDAKATFPEKQAKRVRKEESCDTSTTLGRKLNLELSRQEFEEVLSVLRTRNGPSSHHGPKSVSQSSPEDPTSNCPSGYKPQCLSAKSRSEALVFNLRDSPELRTPPTGKAELFLEAILRASDNPDSEDKRRGKTCDEVSALSRQLSKISLGAEQKKDGVGASGTKRKRLDLKGDPDEDSSLRCDSVSNKKLGESLLAFDDDLRAESYRKNLYAGDVAKTDRNKFECLASTIDERPIASIPRTLKLNKRRCDISDKVPCDAVDGKNISNKSSFAVIKDGVSCSPQVSETEGPRTRIEAVKSDGKVPSVGGEGERSEGEDCRTVPSASEKAKFRRNLDTAASLVFHSRTGLPLTSSPAPVRRNATCFDYDSSINCVSAIRTALFDSTAPTPADDNLSFSSDDAESEGRSPCSPKISFPPARCCWSRYTHLASSLLGSFEESVLNGRLEPVSTVQGFTANLGASGSFCPRHVTLPITVFFYTLGDNDKVSTPYLAHINLGKKGYNVPRCGTIQVTLFNPLGTVVKMFVVMYDLSDMPPNSHTFLRQRTLYMPAKTDSSCQPDDFQKWLRYLIHLRFSSSKSGRIFLHTDIRMIIFRKSDLDTATAHGVENVSYELRSFTQGPTNPKFSSRK